MTDAPARRRTSSGRDARAVRERAMLARDAIRDE
jgi:hypothetical protein